MPDRKRKRRSNRPAALDDTEPLSGELIYRLSLRPFWDRNLKTKIVLPRTLESRRDAAGKEPRDGQ